MPPKSDFVPRRYHYQQIVALAIRCDAAESALVDLLMFIDEDILERHGHDYLAAVQELVK